mmetsp:Transcript_6400/g.26173  ORF Transcript_6400/g.26173 Transcript_6400/m.26173 type:complete len:291 (+) Transcript_6400:608-1480(+)
MLQVLAAQRERDAAQVEQHTQGHDRQHTEAPDQAAGEEAGHEHPQHMPLQHLAGVGERQAALAHRDGRGGHQQVHHTVAECTRRQCHQEERLAHQLGTRPPAGARLRLGQGGEVDARDQQQAQHRHAHQQQVGAGEGRDQQFAAFARQQRAQDGAQAAAGQHPGNRQLAPLGRDQLGGGEAVEGRIGVVVAGDQGGGDDTPEPALQHAAQRQRAAQQRHEQADLEGTPAPEAELVAPHPTGHQRAAGHIGADRQRRHPGAWRQRQADKAVDADEADVVGQQQALGQHQQR